MNKRKNREEPDKVKKKILKLEKRLARYKKKEKRSEDVNDTKQVDPRDQNPDMVFNENNIEEEPLDIEVNSNPGSWSNENAVEELDSDFLSALGESSSAEQRYGDKIHDEIYNTIKNILIDGLPKQVKEQLQESLLIPSNCKLLDAPKLNLELSGLLSNPLKTRDNLLKDRQQDLGLTIGGICQTIHSLSKKEFDKLTIIRKLSEISKILSNMHFNYTEIRRKLVNPSLDKNLAESLKENKRETYLYSNLEDSVKSFSVMKRASNVLKPKQTVHAKPASSKNYQQPPRRQNPPIQAHPGRGAFRGGAPHRYQHQQRQPYKHQDNRQSSIRGRAKYP